MLLRSLPAGAALAAALALWMPTRSEAYKVFGDRLNLAQRDFRICNNFTDPSANSNLVPDSDFPGASGAELAIWKGVAEWGSGPHGSGRTDPFWQETIGSGASNFDAMYSGLATAPGPPNSNIFSELSGFGGVFAFTELPIRDGWRIRFYSTPHVWNDNPSGYLVGGSNAVDLQGVAAHEYGHALGLDHSTDQEATMFGSIQNKGLPMRSIEADDIAGVQFLYGVVDPGKPRIDGYRLVPGGVVLHGAGFHATNNEVWFTHAQPTTGAGGDPIVVAGVPSNGTMLEVAIPANAGPGNVMVRRPGKAPKALSNAHPLDTERDYLPPPRIYGEGKTTSLGLEARMEWECLPSTRIGSYYLNVRDAVPQRPAVLLSAAMSGSVPFQGGTLHLDPGTLKREMAFTIEFWGGYEIHMEIPPAMVGTTRYYQTWFSDPGDPFGSGLTNGVEVTYHH